MDETPNNPTKECALKCSEPKQLFDFPSENAIRELWLYTLGLDKCDENVQVCERHFSHPNPSEMTIPNQNLPENIERKEGYDKLIEKITSTKLVGETNLLRLIENETCLTKKLVHPHPKGEKRNESPAAVVEETEPATVVEESEPSNMDATAVEESEPATVVEESEPSNMDATAVEESEPVHMDATVVEVSEPANTDATVVEVSEPAHMDVTVVEVSEPATVVEESVPVTVVEESEPANMDEVVEESEPANSDATAVEETGPANRDATIAANAIDSTNIEVESLTSYPSKTVAKKVTPSTITEEDLDPISEFMRLATNESPTTTIDVGSRSINEYQGDDRRRLSEDTRLEDDEAFSTLIEEDSQSYNSSDEMREERDFATTIIEETLSEGLPPKGKDRPMILEDIQIEAPLPLAIASQDAVPSAQSAPTQPLPPAAPRPPQESLLNDTSTFLLDYQLCIQGKYMCDVIEIPEYVVVITIPKAKELRPVHDTLYMGHKKKGNVRSLLDIPPSISISRTMSEKAPQNGTGSNQTEEIDYVYYMGEDENPRREREVQADIEITMKDSGDQCDVELDVLMAPVRVEPKPPIHPSDFNKRECLVCGEILLNYLAQVKHFASHQDQLPTLCSYCGEKFTTPQKRIAHEKYHHDGTIVEIKEALRCPRLYCQKVFHSKKQLYHHIDLHIGNAGYKCYICLRMFNSSLQLFRHQRISKLCLKRKMWKQRMFFRRMLEC